MTNRELNDALRELAQGYSALARMVQTNDRKAAADFRRTAVNYAKIGEVTK